jgi:hypothetical protein
MRKDFVVAVLKTAHYRREAKAPASKGGRYKG